MSALRVVAVDSLERARLVQARTRGLWVGAAGLLSLALTVRPFAETGSWGALAVGRLITSSGFPTTEPFSYLPSAHPWVAVGWLHDVLLASLVGAGGAGLTSIAIGLAASAGLVLAALSARTSARVPGAWLAAGVLLGALVTRPFLAGGVAILLLGVGAVLYVLARGRDGQRRALWALPVIFLLWANLDGSFVIGLAILALVWAAESRREPALRRALLIATAVSALAAVINPAGVGLYQWLAASAGSSATQLSMTFASPSFHDWTLRLFEAVAALLVISWIAAGAAARVDLVLAIAAAALALWSQQFVPVYAVIAVPQLASYGWRAWDRAVAPRLPRRSAHAVSPTIRAVAAAASSSPVRGLGVAASLIAVAAVSVVAVGVQSGTHAAAAAEASRDPQAAATHVAAAFPGQRIYAEPLWGDYLAYRFPAGRVVFIYEPGGGFSSAAVATWSTIHNLAPGWESAVRDHGIRVAIVDDRSDVAGGLHELGWAATCFDARSGALVMTAPALGAPTTPSSPLSVPAGVAAC